MAAEHILATLWTSLCVPIAPRHVRLLVRHNPAVDIEREQERWTADERERGYIRARLRLLTTEEGGRHSPTLALSWSTSFPPVVWWLLPDRRRCNLHMQQVAELPQILCRPGVLEENLIDVEGVKLAGTVTIEGLPNTGDQISQLRLVVLRDHRARCPSLRLAGHELKATQRSSSAAPLPAGRTERGGSISVAKSDALAQRHTLDLGLPGGGRRNLERGRRSWRVERRPQHLGYRAA
jgi:hypothetical protein